MKNKIAFFVCLLFILNSCQSIKDGLEGSKKSKSAEEFLIEKKNPLVLPPDYSKLPLPKNVAENNDNSQKFDLEKKLKQNSITSKKNSNKKINNSFEKTIIEKIKKD